jgi:calcineurin-like phosphoesterase family protein
MNSFIISRNNQYVQPSDTLYILGDVIVRPETISKAAFAAELFSYMNATVGLLSGHKQLILGNHDYEYRDNPDFTGFFESVQESKTFLLQKRWIQLYHYPVLNWYRRNKGGIHIYGHMHDETVCRDYEIMAAQPHAFNVSVEVTGYRPVSFDEILQQVSAADSAARARIMF